MSKKQLFNFLATATLCCFAMFMLASCSSSEDNAAGQPTTDIVAPAQLKQGVWTEFNIPLDVSENDINEEYSYEEVAEMPAVGMIIDGNKASFFTYSAEGADELIEGTVSYNKTTGTGTITFPAITGSPISGQTVNFTATSDETLQFEYTYGGEKMTAGCAWLCENLDDWDTEITEEDWKELMAIYQAIDEEPNAHDGHQPVACVTEMLPEFDEADVKGQQHHHDSSNAKKEEQVVQSLLRPLHSSLKLCRQFSCRMPRDDG